MTASTRSLLKGDETMKKTEKRKKDKPVSNYASKQKEDDTDLRGR